LKESLVNKNYNFVHITETMDLLETIFLWSSISLNIGKKRSTKQDACLMGFLVYWICSLNLYCFDEILS